MVRRILVVDDNEAKFDELDPALERAGLKAHHVLGHRDLALALDQGAPAAALIPGGHEELLELVKTIRDRADCRSVPVLFLGYGGGADHVRSPSDALEAGGDYFFKLPTDMDYLAGRVRGWTEGTSVDGAPPLPATDAASGSYDLEALQSPPAASVPVLDRLRDGASPSTRSVGLPAIDTEVDEPPIPSARPQPNTPAPLGADLTEGPTQGGAVAKTEAPTSQTDDLVRGSESSGGQALIRDAEELWEQGNPEDAMDAFETAAELFRADDEPARALKVHRLALSLQPTHAGHAHAGADLALELEDQSTAEEILEGCARAIGPDAAAKELWERLAQLRPDVPSYAMAVELLAGDDGDEDEPPTEDPVPVPKEPSEAALPPAPDAPEAVLNQLDDADLEPLDVGDLSAVEDLDALDVSDADEPPVQVAEDAKAWGQALDAAALKDEHTPEAGPPLLDVDDLDLDDSGPFAPSAHPAQSGSSRAPTPGPLGRPDSGSGREDFSGWKGELDDSLSPMDTPPTGSPIPTKHALSGADVATTRGWFARLPSLDRPRAPREKAKVAPFAAWLTRIGGFRARGRSGAQPTGPVVSFGARAPAPVAPPEEPSKEPRRPSDEAWGSEAGSASLPPPNATWAAAPTQSSDSKPASTPPRLRPPVDAWESGAPSSPPHPPSSTNGARGRTADAWAPGPWLEATQGEVATPVDAVRVLHRIWEAQATGILTWGEGWSLVVHRGEPRGGRGGRVLEAMARRFPWARQLAAPGPRLRPALLVAGHPWGVSTSELDLALSRVVEEMVGQFVGHRGGWSFEVGAPSPNDEELVPPLPLRERLPDAVVEWVPREQVMSQLRGRLRLLDDRRMPRQERERRMLALLDVHPLEEARRLAGLTRERGAALALVWLGQGVLRIDDSGANIEFDERDLPEPKAEPVPSSRRPRPDAPATARSFPPEAGGHVPHRELINLDPVSRIRRLVRLARTSDYFRLLDLTPDADSLAAQRAHAFVRSLVPHRELGEDPSWSALCDEVLEILDEARAVLSDPALRDAYRAHVS